MLKSPHLKKNLHILLGLFGLHSYNLFLHFDMIFFFFLRCGGCTEAVVDVKQNKTVYLNLKKSI